MRHCLRSILICSAIYFPFIQCRQLYNPPVTRANLGYLVVDGIIINGQDSTIINLSRTQNIADSNFVPNTETGARISILGQNGETYGLTELNPGKYVVPALSLNYLENYQLKIITANGKQYLSDTIPVKQTPAIDTVNWKEDSSTVMVFLNTHDPQNGTRYYRWQYVETWQYNAYYNSELIYLNGALNIRTPAQQVYTCWLNAGSTDILLGSSANLSSDIIYQQPLLTDSLNIHIFSLDLQSNLPEVNPRFYIEYSLLVNQYAITEDAYNYWQNLKVNTEELGTIFSPQPASQVPGNIHCVNIPNEPVIGYIGASSLQQKRIFISYSDLFTGAQPPLPVIGCYQFGVIRPDSVAYYFSKPNLFTPVSYEFLVNGLPNSFTGAPTNCANCESQGGINIKPSYWPN
jgi:hypothetical protein